jgi:hypothetical protein
MLSRSRVLSIVGWDGVLPVLVAFTPLLVRAMFPVGHIAEVLAAVLLPIVLALIRIRLGSLQLEQICGENVGWDRQLWFASAIILLLLFEMYVMILHFAKDEPLSAWLVSIVLLGAYVATIWIALRQAVWAG